MVFQHLDDVQDLLNCRLVCQKWFGLAQNILPSKNMQVTLRETQIWRAKELKNPISIPVKRLKVCGSFTSKNLISVLELWNGVEVLEFDMPAMASPEIFINGLPESIYSSVTSIYMDGKMLSRPEKLRAVLSWILGKPERYYLRNDGLLNVKYMHQLILESKFTKLRTIRSICTVVGPWPTSKIEIDSQIDNIDPTNNYFRVFVISDGISYPYENPANDRLTLPEIPKCFDSDRYSWKYAYYYECLIMVQVFNF